MKTIAFILVCVSAMVCFSADAATMPGYTGPSTENTITYSSVWNSYVMPASPDTGRNYVEDIDRDKCACRGIRLYGKVKVVESFPDLKVKIVDAFPDIKVKAVSSFPNDCGKWQFVESFPDFTIKYVDAFPDVKIKFVESFPGM